MDEDGAGQPQQDAPRPGGPEDAVGRVAGDREAERHGQQMARAAAVETTEAAHEAAVHVSRATHLVWRTPGVAGTMTRAGKPWSKQKEAV